VACSSADTRYERPRPINQHERKARKRMAAPTRSIIDTRADQMFPRLDSGEIERMRRFGELRRYAEGALLARVGQVSPGVCVVLAGAIEIVRYDEARRSVPVVTHLPGAFCRSGSQTAVLGESGRRCGHVGSSVRDPNRPCALTSVSSHWTARMHRLPGR